MNHEQQKKPLTEQQIVDQAARRARRWFWFKVGILVLVLLVLNWLVRR